MVFFQEIQGIEGEEAAAARSRMTRKAPENGESCFW